MVVTRDCLTQAKKPTTALFSHTTAGVSMQPDDNDIVYSSYGLDLSPVFKAIYNFFGNAGGSDGFLYTLLAWLDTAWTIWSVVAFFLSFLFIYGIIYSYLRINEYGAKFTEQLEREHRAWKELHGGATKNNRWQQVEQHVGSDRPNDWKLAIIEADIMLGDALSKQGYAGKSIGEQLKSISPQQLSALQDAWDAHLVRNKIAHEGADFVLTQAAARATMVKYERVFREIGEI